MQIDTDKNKIREILSRGVDKVVPSGLLEKQLLSGKRLKLYLGIDPTGTILHLGHSIPLRKLKAFQALGHEVVLLIGDFTAKIGDPTDKLATRQPLTDKQVKENMRTYKKQASKVLDFTNIKIAYNSVWLKKLNFEKIVEIASHFSVQRLLERDMFAKRIKEEKNISLHEFLYPLMQGWDSVMLNVDLELAGSDQLFNAIAGRKLQEIYNHKEKSVLTFKLLSGTDGQKMSKTFGNFIALTDKPQEMFGKIMSIKDGLIKEYFELTTDLPLPEIADIINKHPNPRDQKEVLGFELVKMYHSENEAKKAKEEFNNIFQRKGLPSQIPVFTPTENELNILDLLFESGLAKSKAEAKRLIFGKAIAIDKQLKTDWQEIIKLNHGMIIKAGKRKFIKVKLMSS